MPASPSRVCSRIQSVSSLAHLPVFMHVQQELQGVTLWSMARMISVSQPSSSAAMRAAFRSTSLFEFLRPHERPMIFLVTCVLLSSNSAPIHQES